MADRYASLRQGLVGCWIPSVSGSGLLLPDLSGRGNNGSLVGMDASDWVSSQYGRALDFDGVDDVVRLPFSIEMPFTVSGWFSSRSTTAIQYALSICSSTSNAPHYSLIFDGNAVGDLIYAAQEGDATAFQGSSFTGYVANQMYHLTGVFRSSTNRQLYVNANAQAVNTTLVGTTTVNRLAIGRFDRLSPAVPFDGVADDIRVYNRALSESEIRLLSSEPGIGFKPAKKLSRFSQRFTYNPPKARNYGVTRVKETDFATLRQGLVGAWCPSLPNGGSGNTLPDVSGFNNHGSLVGMSPDDWVSGQYGRALEFDGVNDYILAPSINLPVISLSAWVCFTTDSSQVFIAKRNATDYSWEIGRNAANDQLLVRINANTNVATGGTLPINTWLHVGGTYDGSTIRAYVGGSEVGTFSYTTAIATNTVQTTLAARALFTGAEAFFPLQLDDIRIYSRALTEPEIKLLASRPGIGLRQDRDRNTFYQFPSGARRKRILTGMP